MTFTAKTALLVAATALAGLSSPALADHHKSGKAKGNIVAAAVSSPQLETLEAAVKAAGLVDTLASKGPFTVFAPVDDAFAKLPAGTVDTLLEPENKDQLKAVLTYHVVAGEVAASDLVKLINQQGGTATLTTVQGGTLKASLSGNDVVVTDAQGRTATVIKTDMRQSNGIIHLTDGVFLPG